MATFPTRRSLYGTTTLLLAVLLLAATPVLAQKPESGEMEAKPKDGDLPERILPADTTITKTAEATIRGQRVPYRVTTGTQPVYGEDGKTIAALYYTFYERTDVKDTAPRPLFISFNGGPGSGSLWMHLGYTSPKQLIIDDEGYPIQPYGVRDNPHSILDVADIVYVNPVNTGFSRILDPDAKRETFFGVEPDVTYLADWINVFVSRHQRWRSPKYLIGESYGTTRVSGLAGQLQNRHWMYLNGVILVSPTGLGMTPEGPAPRSAVLKLPYYTAAAHYHGQLDESLQSLPLAEALAEAETFTLDEYLPALSRRGQAYRDRPQGRPVLRAVGAVRARPQSGRAVLRVLEGAAARRGLHHRPTGLALPGCGSQERRRSLRLPARAHLLEPCLRARHQSLPARRARLRNRSAEQPVRRRAAMGGARHRRRGGAASGDGAEPVPPRDGAVGLLRRCHRLLHRQVRALEPRSEWPADRPDELPGVREDLETSNQHIREFIEASTPAEGEPASYGSVRDR